MNITAYNHFTEQLRQKLDDDPRVIGLIALGSMAQQDYQPDEWSDHDFFVITIPGVQEDMRQDLTWLPRADTLRFHFRETDHGLKALYPDGHLLEFAVFSEDELQLARLNRYHVLLDKAELTPQLVELALATQDFVDQSRTAPERRFSELIMNIFVGVARYARGEMLSANQFIRTHTLHHLLRLLAEFIPAEQAALLDNLDPFRRFERIYPVLGAEINQMIGQELLLAAEGLLRVAVRELRPHIQPFPETAVSEVAKQIAKAKEH